jgi:hypothetical protein
MWRDTTAEESRPPGAEAGRNMSSAPGVCPVPFACPDFGHSLRCALC